MLEYQGMASKQFSFDSVKYYNGEKDAFDGILLKVYVSAEGLRQVEVLDAELGFTPAWRLDSVDDTSLLTAYERDVMNKLKLLHSWQAMCRKFTEKDIHFNVPDEVWNIAVRLILY